jgi:hypothetical protein
MSMSMRVLAKRLLETATEASIAGDTDRRDAAWEVLSRAMEMAREGVERVAIPKENEAEE